MKKYQYLLFDLDGTLTDSKLGITRSVQYSLEKMGREIPPADELLSFIGPPLVSSYQEFCGMSEEDAKKATSIYRERYARIGLFENEIYPGITVMLSRLKEAGFTLAIATSKPEEYLTQIMEYFKLDDFFTVISGSSLAGERNSKAEVIEDALRQLAVWKKAEKKSIARGNFRGQEPDEDTLKDIKMHAIMIGDRHHDMEGASTCGIDSLGIHYGYAKEGELKEAGAVYEVDTVEDMCSFFINAAE